MQGMCGACRVHVHVQCLPLGPPLHPLRPNMGLRVVSFGDAPRRRLRGDLQTEAVAEWLARGGEVDARSTRGGEMTMLMAAAVGGVMGTVELLLARRATIDLTDEHGATALMSAPTHFTLPAPPLPPTTKPPPPPFHSPRRHHHPPAHHHRHCHLRNHHRRRRRRRPQVRGAGRPHRRRPRAAASGRQPNRGGRRWRDAHAGGGGVATGGHLARHVARSRRGGIARRPARDPLHHDLLAPCTAPACDRGGMTLNSNQFRNGITSVFYTPSASCSEFRAARARVRISKRLHFRTTLNANNTRAQQWLAPTPCPT